MSLRDRGGIEAVSRLSRVPPRRAGAACRVEAAGRVLRSAMRSAVDLAFRRSSARCRACGETAASPLRSPLPVRPRSPGTTKPCSLVPEYDLPAHTQKSPARSDPLALRIRLGARSRVAVSLLGMARWQGTSGADLDAREMGAPRHVPTSRLSRQQPHDDSALASHSPRRRKRRARSRNANTRRHARHGTWRRPAAPQHRHGAAQHQRDSDDALAQAPPPQTLPAPLRRQVRAEGPKETGSPRPLGRGEAIRRSSGASAGAADRRGG